MHYREMQIWAEGRWKRADNVSSCRIEAAVQNWSNSQWEDCCYSPTINPTKSRHRLNHKTYTNNHSFPVCNLYNSVAISIQATYQNTQWLLLENIFWVRVKHRFIFKVDFHSTTLANDQTTSDLMKFTEKWFEYKCHICYISTIVNLQPICQVN